MSIGQFWFSYVLSENEKLWECIGHTAKTPTEGFAVCEEFWKKNPDRKVYQISHRNKTDDYTDIVVRFGHNNEFDPPDMGVD